MEIVKVKRTTKYGKFYSRAMGTLNVPVTYIKKYIFGIPIQTLHKYRETYYGKVKECEDCKLSK
tara:strand:+ start:862 stop:1053 length:192 start_codon:yes stop_codon:yes gene_type:complete